MSFFIENYTLFWPVNLKIWDTLSHPISKEAICEKIYFKMFSNREAGASVRNMKLEPQKTHPIFGLSTI